MSNKHPKDMTLEFSQWTIIGVVELNIPFEQSYDLIQRISCEVLGIEIPDLKRVRTQSQKRYKELTDKLERNELYSENDRHELIYLQIAFNDICE